MKKTDYDKAVEVAKDAVQIAMSLCAKYASSPQEKGSAERVAKRLISLQNKEAKKVFKTVKQAILPFAEPCTGCVFFGDCEEPVKCDGYVYIKDGK